MTSEYSKFPKFKNYNFHLFMQMKILMSSDENYYIGKDGYNSDPHPCGSHLTNNQSKMWVWLPWCDGE